MTTFRCLSDILITSRLFTARWSTWPGNQLVPCVAELVGSRIPIHAHRCLPDPKCLFYPSGLLLCLSVDHFCLVPVDDMVLFHGMVCDGWLVSYTALSLALEARVYVPGVKESLGNILRLCRVRSFYIIVCKLNESVQHYITSSILVCGQKCSTRIVL